jgi:hypothetical protein
LISRSDIFCIASANAGDGPAIGWLEVTMYMKRMKNSLGASSDRSGRKPARYGCDD